MARENDELLLIDCTEHCEHNRCHSPCRNERAKESHRKCRIPIGVAIQYNVGQMGANIVAGDAAAAIVHYRMNANATEVRMPEIGRSVIHTEAVELIEQLLICL